MNDCRTSLDSITYLAESAIDRQMALLLLETSIQAYTAFDADHPAVANFTQVTAPEGYELVDSWTGVDALLGRYRHIENYGLVFRSVEEPYTYIFAFRGTDSWEDICDDFGFNQVKFAAYAQDVVVPTQVRVEYGFSHIYTDLYEGKLSMQQQLFNLVDKYLGSPQPLDRLYVTGHSLGCTLATLFALDLALARPEIPVTNYNYASPRVGNQAFVDFYQRQKVAQKTIRFQNIFDKVPHTPLAIQGYRHLPNAYLIAFYRDRIAGKLDMMANHSVMNYQKVLQYIFQESEPDFELIFPGKNNQQMKSIKPDPNAIADF